MSFAVNPLPPSRQRRCGTAKSKVTRTAISERLENKYAVNAATACVVAARRGVGVLLTLDRRGRYRGSRAPQFPAESVETKPPTATTATAR